MDLTEDFCNIQGLLTSIHANIGDFKAIRYTSGNEAKIAKIIEDLKQWLNRKKYFRDGMMNYKREMSIRKLVLLLILNSELKTQSLFSNRVSHLIGIIPTFSNFLLTTVVFELNLYEFFAEAITSLPLEISLELLENCNKQIAKSDPYLILKQTSVLAQAVYFKIYHLRYEKNDKLHNLSVKLLDKFMSILKNYITPVTDKLLNWPTVKMYQYMGKAIYEILNLLKTCFSTFQIKEFVNPYYQFYQFNSDTNHPLIDSPANLNQSIYILKECNKTLISICEENIASVSVDVFCSWVECKQDNLTLQQAIRTLAYDVIQQLKLIDETSGDLFQMLGSFAMNPQPIEEIINMADEATILESVCVENEHQTKWFKALIKLIFKSDEFFNIFKMYIHLCDHKDLIYLLNLNSIKNEYNLKDVLTKHLSTLTPEENIQIIVAFFAKHGLNTHLQNDNFNESLQETFNKLIVSPETEIPLLEISQLVLQNPGKFLEHILDEAEKNPQHLKNLLFICEFIRGVCLLQIDETNKTLLREKIAEKLTSIQLDNRKENCFIEFVSQLIENKLLCSHLFDDIKLIFNDLIICGNYERATFICRLCKVSFFYNI